jgi:putative ABC transport system permease protein
MLRKIAGSFLLAFENIRSQLFHTLLSVLGIVIGVAALVSILSLIDGMERFAKEQISTTTSLNAIILRSEVYKHVNDVRIRKDTFDVLDYHNFLKLKNSLTKPALSHLRSISSDEVGFENKLKVGSSLIATSSHASSDAETETGKFFSEQEVGQRANVAVVNKAFVKAVNSRDKEIVGKEILYKNQRLKIIGVLKKEAGKNPQVIFPITLLSEEEFKGNLPEIIFDAQSVEDVQTIKSEITSWLKANLRNGDNDFSILTNEVRVKQAEQGFLLFRVIMGLIVGISVLVGGIGVMNVLLISVTERTSEIGIRKAMGANRRDIIFQFLAESVTVSTFGSVIGLITGVLGTMIIIPIVKAITKVPFQADYTLNTLIVISIIAVLTGIVFGTYPAIRASRLDPIEAIRRE